MANETADPSDILPPEYWAQLVAASDSGEEREDSDKESSASLYPSIFEYRTLHGRTYHPDTGDAQYWATNDKPQKESLDLFHHCCTVALDGKLYLAPLKKNIQNALDIGTGTGIWAIDFATEFPNADVAATDITPVQPSFIPHNLKFEMEDANNIWAFPDNHFDYIHARWLLGCVTDWETLFARAYAHLRPGGWLESYELSAFVESDDGSVGEGSALGQWGKIFVEGGRKMGVSFRVLEEELQRKAMEKAGFVEIQERNIKMPIGAWPTDAKAKELGVFTQAALEQDIEGYILFTTDALGWTRDQILVYMSRVTKEIKSKKNKPYYRQKVVFGRKPL